MEIAKWILNRQYKLEFYTSIWFQQVCQFISKINVCINVRYGNFMKAPTCNSLNKRSEPDLNEEPVWDACL